MNVARVILTCAFRAQVKEHKTLNAQFPSKNFTFDFLTYVTRAQVNISHVVIVNVENEKKKYKFRFLNLIESLCPETVNFCRVNNVNFRCERAIFNVRRAKSK